MQCPVCDVTLSISSRDGVEIDFCPQCRGVWLDRGELDKIIDRVASSGARPEEPRRPEPERRPDRDRYEDRDRRDDRHDRYDDRRYDKRKKKRSFLEDIFDFD